MDDDTLPSFDKLGQQLEEMTMRHRQQYEQWRAKGNSRNKLIKAAAVDSCSVAGRECWIVKPPIWEEMEILRTVSGTSWALEVGYSGYAVFPQKPVVEPGYRGILAYVPVHGGITYYEEDESGHVYGFDTCHYNSSEFPIRDLDWIKNEILLMILGIEMAAKVEPAYLAADGDNHRRAELVQPLVDLAEGGLNFGTMLNLLSGEL